MRKNAALVGTTQRVLCEGFSRKKETTLTGRNSQNKPIIFTSDVNKLTGQMLDIKIEQIAGFTLYGDAVTNV